MKKKYSFYLISATLYCCLLGTISCNKQNEFLDAKPNQSLIVPVSLSDYESILNNTNVFNFGDDPALGEISSDDFYIQQSVFDQRTATERNTYTWAKDIYDAGVTPGDWSQPYIQVYYSNTVLDGLPNVQYTPAQQSLFNQVKGTALFYRSYAFYELVQTFALPYDPTTAATTLGIPIRLNSDITIKSTRATEAACYARILSDLKAALPLLPLRSTIPTAPCRIAANAMLARVYLGMSDYSDAYIYANACLADDPGLTDYNTLTTPTTTAVNSSFISEDIYHTSMTNYSLIAVRRNTVADSNLYASYDDNDLRKTKFFAILDGLPQYPRFVGSYDFAGNKYDGLATDEIYLIRAECSARAGNTAAAMADLNTLLLARWVTGTFIPYTAVSAADALNQVLAERRKELVFRGLRWTDLRRLNLDSRFKTTLVRNIDSTTYTLPPNDPRYALPLPDAEISLSGLIQNQR